MGTAEFDAEDWYPEMEAEIESIFENSVFGYTDPDVIDREVARFAEFLAGTPSATRRA
jgi:hypothetical protein